MHTAEQEGRYYTQEKQRNQVSIYRRIKEAGLLHKGRSRRQGYYEQKSKEAELLYTAGSGR